MECGEGIQWPPQLPGYDLGKLTHGGNDGRGPTFTFIAEISEYHLDSSHSGS